MSHFVTVVLVPLSREQSRNPMDTISKLLEPYDENMEVEPYERRCGCVGLEAEIEANTHGLEEAKKVSGTDIEKLRTTYWAMDEDERPDWDDHISVYAKTQAEAKDEFLSKRDDRDSPDPGCKECGGTGAEIVTYNPKSKWDWFRVGGRWDGWIQGTRRESEDNGFNFGEEHTEARHNCISAEVYLQSVREDEDFVPFALVTPDGVWHEKGEMGWFAMVNGKKSSNKWRDEIISLLEANADTIAVACDLHI